MFFRFPGDSSRQILERTNTGGCGQATGFQFIEPQQGQDRRGKDCGKSLGIFREGLSPNQGGGDEETCLLSNVICHVYQRTDSRDKELEVSEFPNLCTSYASTLR